MTTRALVSRTHLTMPVPGITSDPDGAQLAWAVHWWAWQCAEYDVALDPYRYHAAHEEFKRAMHAARRWWDERVREERAA
jgi:hypothetical protein